METPPSTSFAALLKRYRLAAGLSQEELAGRAGMSPRGVSDLERGKRTKPQPGNLRRLADALGLTESDRVAFLAAAHGIGTRPDGEAAEGANTEAQKDPEQQADAASPVPQPGIHTFLIADIRGYTRFTVEQGDEAAAELASKFARLAQEVVEAHGGHVIELRGDEALAVFVSARQALRAAVKFQALLADETRADPALPLRVGIGLDAGEASPVGDGYRGAALNLAARLCSLAVAGEALASEGVIHLARKVTGIEYEARGAARFKGFADPIGVYRVVDAQEDRSHHQDVLASEMGNDAAAGTPVQPVLPPGGFLGAEPEERMVAREAEIERLDALLDAVVAGSGRVVLLAGEPGVGKTRLAQEVMLAARARGFVVATGRCYEPQQTVAYYPFLEALHHIYLQTPPTLQREATTHWPMVARLVPDLPVSAEQLGVSGERLSLGSGGAGLGSEDEQQRLFWQVTGFLQALAAERPLALLVDDLHWADGASLALLQHLARHTRTHRVFVLGTYRDVEVNRRHPLEGALRDLLREQLLERVAVRRLTVEGTTALIRAMLETAEAPQVAQLLYLRAEGNPFFTRELLRDLLEQGVISPDGTGAPSEGGAEMIAVPESVRSVIGQRLGRLAEETQEVLLNASVLGQTFAFVDLCAMSDRDDGVVERALEEAVAAGMVWEVRAAPRQADYSFSHALLQQALAAELSSRRRRRLHQAAGEAIERRPEQERTRRCAELAWHFLEADAPARALPYVLQAGEQAFAVYAFAEAGQHFQTAEELAQQLGDEEAQLRAEEQLGLALMYAGQDERAFEVLEPAVAEAERRGDLSWQARLLTLLFDVGGEEGARAGGASRLQRLIAVASADGPNPGLAQLYLALAKVYVSTHQEAEGLDAAEQALQVALAVGNARLGAEARLWRGEHLMIIGRYEEARSEFEEGVLALEGVSDAVSLDSLRFAYTVLGLDLSFLGQWDAAQDHLEHALVLKERLGDPYGLVGSCDFLADMALLRGDWAATRRYLERAAELRAQLGSDWNNPFHTTHLLRIETELHLAQGDVEAAVQCAEAALPLTKKAGTLAWRWHAIRLLAELDLHQGNPTASRDWLCSVDRADLHAVDLNELDVLMIWSQLALGSFEAAEELVSSALTRLREQHDHLNLVDALRAEAAVHTRQRRWDAAETAVEESLALAHQMGYPYAEAKALAIAGDLWMSRRQPAQARDQYEAALAILYRLGERAHAVKIEQKLAKLDEPSAGA